MKLTVILLFVLFLPFSTVATVNAQVGAITTLTLTKFEASDVYGDDVVLSGHNRTSDYEELVITPQNSFTMEIYDEEITYTFPDPPPPTIPVPILPPPDFHIYINLARRNANVGIRVDNGTHSIEFLDGIDETGLFATIEDVQGFVDLTPLPGIEFIETSEEFGVKLDIESEYEYTDSDGHVENQTYILHNERRYSKETGLLTFLMIDEGHADYECCGWEKHVILESKSNENPFKLDFNGFLYIPLIFVDLIFLKKRVKKS